jgi:hypothetical protein
MRDKEMRDRRCGTDETTPKCFGIIALANLYKGRSGSHAWLGCNQSSNRIEGETGLLLARLGSLLGSRLLPRQWATRLPFQHASELR